MFWQMFEDEKKIFFLAPDNETNEAMKIFQADEAK